MIVVVSNRNVNPDPKKPHETFGDKPNSKGLDELRVATARYKNGWKVDLLPEKRKDVESGNPPSRQLFQQIYRDICAGKLKGDWVLFVHGFNQTFRDNLTKCRAIEKIYGVNVLAFSWPSNQGGFKTKEYEKARSAARGSTNAFDRMLEKLGYYLLRRPHAADCTVRLSLMAYSMGNFVVENFVRAPVFSDETKIFDNVILTQADVDVATHAEWCGKMTLGKRIYVTINENDSVLKWSDVVNPPRLGNTARHLAAANTIYFDFTDGKNVGSTHGIFYKTARKNPTVKEIFSKALYGKRAERVTGIVFNEESNAFELSD
jgi:esterase/lipase superfamily enzyme